MRLSQLLKLSGISVLNQHGFSDDIDIVGIAYDSRNVIPGDLYVSIPGVVVHGDSFISDAIKAGALAIVTETAFKNCPVPVIQVESTRKVLGILGRTLWNVSIESMDIIGVTGTNGKTTVTHLFKELLGCRYSEEDVWMFGTIDFLLGTKRIAATHTTPESLDIFRYVSKQTRPPNALIMEVSSHSLALDRIYGLEYDIAVWTNLTQDHLDFHKTMESYYNAKKKMFTDHIKANGTAIINVDDQWGKRLSIELANKKVLTFGKDEQASVRIKSYKCDWDGSSVELVVKGVSYTYNSALKGSYNVYNMTAMVAGAIALGFPEAIVHDAFDKIETVAGRMDRVPVSAPFSVVVDYAHTPDALVNVLQAARELTNGRLICVFGCGGDRDKTKRPLMAQAVIENCDEAVITSDNPRTEKPMSIIEQIISAVPLDFPHRVIENREEAIVFALKNAQKSDCVIIAGKGHESYQEINGVKHHFNDKEVVMHYFDALQRKDLHV